MVVEYTPAAGGAPTLEGYTPTCQLLDGAGERHTLTATMAGDFLSVTLAADAEATAQWAVGSASLDMKLTNGTVVITDTLTFPIIPQITLI